MGDRSIIRQEANKAGCATDLAQLRESGVEVGQSRLQHFAMTWILGSVELLQ